MSLRDVSPWMPTNQPASISNRLHNPIWWPWDPDFRSAHQHWRSPWLAWPRWVNLKSQVFQCHIQKHSMLLRCRSWISWVIYHRWSAIIQIFIYFSGLACGFRCFPSHVAMFSAGHWAVGNGWDSSLVDIGARTSGPSSESWNPRMTATVPWLKYQVGYGRTPPWLVSAKKRHRYNSQTWSY